jgi:hypothetical protein
MVKSKDCTDASRTRFAHAPPRQHGPWSYPLYSSDSERSRGKTLVFPLLRQFSVPKLSSQMIFCKMMNFQLMILSKIFPKTCMFLPLLCLSTILALTCPVSCQPCCSLPPSSGSVGAACFYPFSRSTTAPTRSCAAAPTPSPSKSGRVTRWSPSATLRLAQQQTPRLAARVAAADCRARAQAVLPQQSGFRFLTCWFLCLLLPRRCNETIPEPFPTQRGGFCMHGTGGTFTASTDAVPVPVNGHCPRGWTSDLFSSQLRPELGVSPVESCLRPWRWSNQSGVF